jgi:hypothetical protein
MDSGGRGARLRLSSLRVARSSRTAPATRSRADSRFASRDPQERAGTGTIIYRARIILELRARAQPRARTWGSRSRARATSAGWCSFGWCSSPRGRGDHVRRGQHVEDRSTDRAADPAIPRRPGRARDGGGQRAAVVRRPPAARVVGRHGSGAPIGMGAGTTASLLSKLGLAPRRAGAYRDPGAARPSLTTAPMAARSPAGPRS